MYSNLDRRYILRAKYIGIMLCSAILLTLLTGCGGSYRSSQLSSVPLEEQEQIVYRNLTLKTSIAVMDHHLESAGNLMKLRAKFKNTMGKTINAEIRVKFLDSSGYEITDNWGWQPFTFQKGEIKDFERVAPSPNAADYKIFLRLADTD